MRLRETLGAVCLILVIGTAVAVAPAGATELRLSQERFDAVDPVFEGLIAVSRKNQAPAIIRRALDDLARRCAGLNRRDPLQRATFKECQSLIKRSRLSQRLQSCRGLRHCGRMLARFGREHAKALKLARRANGVYRRQLRGRCLASFATPKSDLHLINRLQYRFARLARAYIRRDGLGIFIEHLILDQVLAGVEDGGGAQARRDWRAFRSACRPVAVSAPTSARPAAQ